MHKLIWVFFALSNMLMSTRLDVMKLSVFLSIIFLCSPFHPFTRVSCLTWHWSESPNSGAYSSRMCCLIMLHEMLIFCTWCGVSLSIAIGLQGSHPHQDIEKLEMKSIKTLNSHEQGASHCNF